MSHVFTADALTVTDCATSFGSVEFFVHIQVVECEPPLDFTSHPDEIEHLRPKSVLNNLSYNHEYRHRRVSFSDDASTTEPKSRLNNHTVIDVVKSALVEVVFDLEVSLDRSQITVHCRQPESGKISNILWSCSASFEFTCQTHPYLNVFTTEGWFNNVCSSLTFDIPDKKGILSSGRSVHPTFQMRVLSKEVYPVKVANPADEPSVESDFGSLFLEESVSDFHFVSGNYKIPSHRLILTERCNFFRQAMQPMQQSDKSKNKEKKKQEVASSFSMNIPFEVQPLLSFLRFLYCKEVTLPDTVDSLAELLVICKAFNFNSLIRAAFALHSQENSLIFLRFRRHLPQSFIDRLWKVIDSCAVSILRSKYFLSLTSQEIIEIIDRDTFYAPELVILNACISWAEEECVRNNVSATDFDCMRGYLNEILKYIRFNRFERTDFLMMQPRIPCLLTPAEIKAILRRINASNDDEPMGLDRFVTRPRRETRLF